MTPEERKLARKQRAELGLCNEENCPDKPVEGKKKCQKHLDMAAKREANARTRSAVSGLCERCHKHPPVKGGKHCQDCLNYVALKNRQYYQQDPSKQKARATRWYQKKRTKG